MHLICLPRKTLNIMLDFLELTDCDHSPSQGMDYLAIDPELASAVADRNWSYG